MRKSIVVGTKEDVAKLKAKIDKATEEFQQAIDAGVNPYQAVVEMDAKLHRITTFNHPCMRNWI